MSILSVAPEKIFSGSRLNVNELLALYEENDLLYLAKSARHVNQSEIFEVIR